ncbi:hypothetical protein HHK36_024859 [Tetracentron sinense]|uniref:Uncharacterized protein n=1 Tax=Tetracentron sinense TaxID=13715 RepID=A0A835D7W3_TETSI|nr:hypothetical protein HHK36_024859 [Tetracentron sinense]
MAVIIQLWPLLSLLFFFSVLPLSSSQQNIETSFPSGNPPVIPTPNSPNSPPPSKATSNRTVAKAVGATAASTLVIAGVFFFILRYTAARRRRRNEKTETGVPRVEPVVSLGEFKRYDGTVKGLIVDENGLDVLYWRELEGGHSGKTFSNWVLPNPNDEEEEWKIREGNSRMKSEPRQEIPLLRGKNSNSSSQMSPELQNFHQIIAPPSDGVAVEAVAKPVQPPLEKNRAPPPPPPLQAGTSAGQTNLEPLHMDKVKANTDQSMAWNKINGGSFG